MEHFLCIDIFLLKYFGLLFRLLITITTTITIITTIIIIMPSMSTSAISVKTPHLWMRKRRTPALKLLGIYVFVLIP